MRTASETASGRLRQALTGSPTTPMVLFGNFEVENQWAVGEAGLPRLAMAESRAIVERMDQFALLLAEPGDTVVLSTAPDAGFLDHLEGLGLELPAVLVPADPDPSLTLTENALRDARVMGSLTQLAADGAFLWPHGVSAAEEQLAAETGLRLAAAAAAVCKEVNSKVYSRTIAEELGLSRPPGFACRDLEEFDEAVDQAARWLDAGLPAVVKDAFGVSGKGIAVVRERRTLDQIQRMIRRRAERTGSTALALVVEEWVPKRMDLNYQFTLDRDGRVGFDFVKEALTQGGVHKGHVVPADVTAEELACLHRAADLIGARLAADGYHGVVGVDAMLGPGQEVYPVIEINARNNMSTYQERLLDRLLGPGRVALATHHAVRLTRRLDFATVRTRLNGLMYEPERGTGIIVNNFGTVNAGAGRGRESFEGRLYTVLVADDRERLGELDRETGRRLAGIEEEMSGE